MRTVTVQISDTDFEDLVAHFARPNPLGGKPLVGVIALVDVPLDPEACPGCGCLPGEGVTKGCVHPDGCGFDTADHNR